MTTQRENLKRKFQNLQNRSNPPQREFSNQRTVINLSGHNLSDSEKNLLSKGLNFAPTPRYIPIETYISKVEPVIQSLP